MVIKEIRLGPQPAHRESPALSLAQKASPLSPTNMVGRENSILTQTLPANKRRGTLTRPLYGACRTLVLKPMRKAHGNPKTPNLSHSCTQMETQKSCRKQSCMVNNVTCQNQAGVILEASLVRY